MSRSYKKVVLKDGGVSRKWWKRHCNKKVRNNPNLDNGGAFRKASELWDWDDYNYSGGFKLRPQDIEWLEENPRARRINGSWYISK